MAVCVCVGDRAFGGVCQFAIVIQDESPPEDAVRETWKRADKSEPAKILQRINIFRLAVGVARSSSLAYKDTIKRQTSGLATGGRKRPTGTTFMRLANCKSACWPSPGWPLKLPVWRCCCRRPSRLQRRRQRRRPISNQAKVSALLACAALGVVWWWRRRRLQKQWASLARLQAGH